MSSIRAQQSDSSFNYENDYILKKIVQVLPKGWSFYENNGKLIIEKNDSVTILDKKVLHIPYNHKPSDDTILKYGERTKSQIIYKFEPRWSFEQTVSANSNNIPIYKEISNLPEKYKITGLIDKSQSTRVKKVYTGNTKEEKNRILQYEKEKDSLTSKIVLQPNYNTEKYSLFLLSVKGGDYENFSMYPKEALIQLYDILNLFNELTEKSNQ